MSIAELALQQQFSSLYTAHHHWLRGLLLCKLDGLSYRDIVATLHVSVSSVEKYIAAVWWPAISPCTRRTSEPWRR
ncbi:DNA-directed RNA polymerase specialized sigma24 family protein [Janthinobacterium sp. CG_23.4]|nr:DNA-directed RNA polymerase specialized sigma24 family protein [Janthinobacterium sp. CG_23.4]